VASSYIENILKVPEKGSFFIFRIYKYIFLTIIAKSQFKTLATQLKAAHGTLECLSTPFDWSRYALEEWN